MEIIYTKGWSSRRRIILEKIPKEEARNLYSRGRQFSAVTGEEGKPYCFIDFGNKFIYVGFLDDYKRNYLSYEYLKYNFDKIILKDIYSWKYEADTDNKQLLSRYRIAADGNFTIEKTNYKTDEKTIKRGRGVIEGRVLWEDYPEFDNYNNIIMIKRIKTV